jgi:hypothetical protein
MPKGDNFKSSCGLPQCPYDQLSGQMSRVTENKFIFPQWRERRKKKKQFAHMRQILFHLGVWLEQAQKCTITM